MDVKITDTKDNTITYKIDNLSDGEFNYLIENLKEGKIYSSDVFYTEIVDYKKMYEETGCIGVEMESFALFSNAKHLNKKAATILTVSNNFETNEETTSDERQNAFTDMVILALESFL